MGIGNVGTAFKILAEFASVEVWSSYPLVLPGEAASELSTWPPARPSGQRSPEARVLMRTTA
jgi:hypothetical protein